MNKFKQNSSGKSPSFPFYPNDWLNDVALQTCSVSAIGVYINLICLMHQCDPYGYLAIGDQPLDLKEALNLAKIRNKKRHSMVLELLQKGVLKKDEKGRLYSKRMVEDFRLRQLRREAGSKGGNPVLLNQKVNQQGYPFAEIENEIEIEYEKESNIKKNNNFKNNKVIKEQLGQLSERKKMPEIRSHELF